MPIAKAQSEEVSREVKKHLIYGFMPVGMDVGITIERGEGVWLYDLDGNKYFDLESTMVSCNVGHGRQDIVDAMMEQARKLAFGSVIYGYMTSAVAENVRRLADEVTPEGLNHFALCNSGSEAVELTIRLARMYWASKGQPDKRKIISNYSSYHGVTGVTHVTSGVGSGAMNPWNIPNHIHVPPPYCYRCPYGQEYPSCDIFCAKFLEGTIKREFPNTVAAVLFECNTHHGGVIGFHPAPPEYIPMVRKMCNELGVLWIDDEVMTGFGRTGKMFACQHYGVIPDIMTMSKAITGCYFPYAATAMSDEVYKGIEGQIFTHAHTHSGNPVGAAASNKIMDIYAKEKVVENAAKVGEHISKRLEAEFMELPCVGRATQRGVMGCIELVTDKKTKAPFPLNLMREQVWLPLLEKGILEHAVAFSSTLGIAPPCTTTVDEVDWALDRIKSVLAAAKPG